MLASKRVFSTDKALQTHLPPPFTAWETGNSIFLGMLVTVKVHHQLASP